MNTQVEPVTTAVTVGEILDRYERDCMDELGARTQIDYRPTAPTTFAERL